MSGQKSQNQLSQVKKRDGRIVPFDQNKITEAILKAMEAVNEERDPEERRLKESLRKDAVKVCDKVVADLKKKYRQGGIPGIEEIQDIVEEKLTIMDFYKAAKAYILYRHDRTMIRAQKKEVPDRVKELALKSRGYFRNAMGEFVGYRSYSRWQPEEGRRETWIESGKRYMDFMKFILGKTLSDDEYNEIEFSILNHKSMPSMRLLWSAGKAALATNVTAYNCAYVAPKLLKDFGEIMYILMCGTGVGFSVEDRVIQALPQIHPQRGEGCRVHVVEDSKEGWANAFVLGLETWYSGYDVKFDYSKIRPYGSRLHTMGGRASGPEPLKALLDFTRERILKRQGRRLKSIDVHDIICKIGVSVEMGGVRRSAELSLSDLDDLEMRMAKTGNFLNDHPERRMANNSAVYLEKPNSIEFLEEWMALIKSKSGERGIFNRGGLRYQLPQRRLETFGPYFDDSGTNPCGEIWLRLKQFCNVTEVVARFEDTLDTLLEKIRIATILGTYQSMLTDFSYLSSDWKNNCEEERLLGVSITGQWDCPMVRNEEVFSQLKAHALEINQIYAKRFGINPSTCVTCVKPSGTVSQLVDASSGMHPRYSPHYIRRIEIDASDPLWKMLRDQKVPYQPKYGQVDGLATQYILEFPVKSPKNAICTVELSAIEQLAYWKMVKTRFTEHNPSVSIYVGEDEWLPVANWLYNNWDILGGLSFFPRDDTLYPQPVYEPISEEKYNELDANFPEIDFSQILTYEKEDETKGSHELACVANQCEV